jgi:hypothetical protein
LPGTAAGKCAAAYIDAFNSGSDEKMRAFVEKYRSPAFLEHNPIDKRLEHQNRLRGIFGELTPVRVALSFEFQLTLLNDPKKSKDAVVMRFQLEKEAPHYLDYVTISGIDHFEVPDEYVAYVATKAAPMNKALRDSTVQSVAESLRDIYVFPELGQRMANALLRNQAEGKYDDLRRAAKLAEKLTEDARAVSNDLHIWVEVQNPMAQASADPVNRDVGLLRQKNYDFREVKVLAGNIGYMKFDMIHDDEEALEITARALADVSGCSALIFDLRNNIGGEWGTAGMILGYLLPGGTLLGYLYDRDGSIIEERTVPDSIQGVPFDDDVPVYVLTSAETGSAAEALAYTLKHMRSATIVGEVSRGMAHPSKEVVVNDYFRVSVPFMRSENALTGTDWEGVGVTPQIKVKADDALKTAIKDARKRIREKE